MSRSPLEAKTTEPYNAGWQALNRRLRQGGSLSGHETNNFYWNCGKDGFVDASGITGLDFPGDGRAFAIADLDNDGDQDIILKNRTGPQIRILRNDIDNSNRAVSFDLREVGARVRLETETGLRTKAVQAGSGFLSQSSRRVWFGLGEQDRPVSVTIEWSSGRRQRFEHLAVGHRYAIRKGRSDITAIPFLPRRQDPPPPVMIAEESANRGSWLIEPLPAPDLQLEDLEGNLHRLSDHRGRPVLLNFWATWCPPCKQELLDLQSAAGDLLAEAVVLTVSVDEPSDRSKVAEFSQEYVRPFPTLLADAAVIDAYNVISHGLFSRKSDLAVPASFLIDGDGRIVKAYRGAVAATQFTEDFTRIPGNRKEALRAALPFDGDFYVDVYAREYSPLADAFLKAGLAEPARVYYEFHLEREPRSSKAWNNLGLALAIDKRPKEAIRAIRKALDLDPSFAEAHQNLATAQLRAGQPQRALSSFATAVSLGLESAQLFKGLGEAHAATGQDAEAVRSYQRAHRLDPEDAEVLLNMGGCYFNLRKYREAIYVYERGFRLLPEEAELPASELGQLYNTLGVAYDETGALDKAKEALEKAVHHDRESPAAQNNLGLVYRQLGEVDAAQRAFEQAVNLNPDGPAPYRNLARLFLDGGDPTTARAWLLKLLDRHPDDPEARKLLGLADK